MFKFPRHISVQPKNDVVTRVDKLHRLHTVNVSALVRLVPGLRYQDFQSDAALLAALTPSIIDKLAQVFGVRRQWLEGLDDFIYQPQRMNNAHELLKYLVETQRTAGDRETRLHILIAADPKRISQDSSKPQRFLPVLTVEQGDDPEYPFYRCHILAKSYDWTKPAQRLELKAVARSWYLNTKRVVPLVQVKPREVEQISEGRLIPSMLFGRSPVTEPSLEDYVLSSAESRVSKETDELPALLEYVQAHGLQDLWTTTAPTEETAGSSSEPIGPQPGEPPLSGSEPQPAKPKPGGKRDISDKNWANIVAAAQTLWSQDPQATYASVIAQLQEMPHLKAIGAGESAIRKRLRAVAPAGVRGKSGRPKKSS